MTGVLYGRNILEVAAGWHHSLALDSEGNIFAWGANGRGQLGSGTLGGGSNVPVAVDMTGMLADRNIIQVAAGNNHSLALDSEGNIFAWGIGINGQLGDGAATDSGVPVVVDTSGVLAGRKIIQISAGGSHSLALDSEGSIFAWGGNWDGQLGNGTNTTSNVPVIVDTSGVLAGRNIVQVVAATSGGNHSLALDDKGNIFAWGHNVNGQLGDGMVNAWGWPFPYSNTPVAVDMTGVLAGSSVTQIAASQSHSLALDSKGNVFSWGGNWSGQLGNGTTTGSNIPLFVMNLGVPTNPIQSVTLGGLYCTNIQIINPNTITCIVPAHPAGTVDVVVNTLHGSATLYQGYTYIDIPDVPNTGHLRKED